jgi:hypothetical protein
VVATRRVWVGEVEEAKQRQREDEEKAGTARGVIHRGPRQEENEMD